MQTREKNRSWVLAERPVGMPDERTLRLETGPVPEPEAGQMLLRTEWLSIDPYMRGRMNDAKSYAEPVPIGGVMTGQVVAEVVKLEVEMYPPSGTLVMCLATSTRRKDSRSPTEAIVPSIVPEFIASNWSKTDICTGTAPKFSASRAQGAPPDRRRRP